MKQSIIRIICFLLILAMVLGYTNRVFQLKHSDGIYSLTKFYELEDNSVDVLILGSSHAFENFNTGVLWDSYGMASYILAGSMQPMWNTYYYLKEALKTQTPELIILEGYLTMWDQDYMEDSTTIKNNFGLKWSKNKIDSLKASVPRERWAEFFLSYEQYHTRYTELSAADFLPNQNNRLYDDWKGFGCNMKTTPLDSIDVSALTQKMPLHTKTEQYYRATIELALQNSIPIVVIISPYAGIQEDEHRRHNSAGDIAAEYGIPFLNCNTLIDEIGLDYTIDAGDPAHLNYRGNQKFSRYIGAYLKDNFQISDRRGQETYASWQRSADFTRQMIKDQQLTESWDLNEISGLLQDPEYLVIISIDGNCNAADETVRGFLMQQGISEEALYGIWQKDGASVTWHSGAEYAERYIRTAAHDFCLRRSIHESGQYANSIVMDNTPYRAVENGVNVLVFDRKTDKIADVFGINTDDHNAIVRYSASGSSASTQ